MKRRRFKQETSLEERLARHAQESTGQGAGVLVEEGASSGCCHSHQRVDQFTRLAAAGIECVSSAARLVSRAQRTSVESPTFKTCVVGVQT